MKVLSRYIAKGNDAGPKAKVDIENVLKEQYGAKIVTYKMKSEKNGVFEKIKKVLFFWVNCHSKDILVCQHPLINIPYFYKKAKYKICIIHDLGYFRTYDKNLLKKEIRVFNEFDSVIVHNKRMYEFLSKNGVKKEMFILELFDYLSTIEIKEKEKNLKKEPIVIYPGNWDKEKASFLYDLSDKKMNFKINIYGPNKDNSELKNKKIKYKGCYSPEEIIEKMDGDLGLVWSGKIDDSDRDEGDKKYNLYNTPHKLSCFLAAGIPVIVWEDSAIAEVVKKYNIGYTIKNIYEINDLNFSDYAVKIKNVSKVRKRIIAGDYTVSVMKKCLNNQK